MCDVGIHFVVSLQMESSLGECFCKGQSFIVILLKKAGGPHGALLFNGEKSTCSCSYFLDLSHNTQISRELHV